LLIGCSVTIAMLLPAARAGAATGPAQVELTPALTDSQSAVTVRFSAQPASGEQMQALELSGATEFSITADACSARVVMDSCTVDVAFRPNAVGAREATLKLTGTGGAASVKLLARGYKVGPLFLAPYSAVIEGDASPIAFSNDGDLPLEIGSLQFDGPDAAAFALAADGCSGVTLPPLGGCVARVSFVSTLAVCSTRRAVLRAPSSDGARHADVAVAITNPSGCPIPPPVTTPPPTTGIRTVVEAVAWSGVEIRAIKASARSVDFLLYSSQFRANYNLAITGGRKSVGKTGQLAPQAPTHIIVSGRFRRGVRYRVAIRATTVDGNATQKTPARSFKIAR
jgi:hypothetical protein